MEYSSVMAECGTPYNCGGRNRAILEAGDSIMAQNLGRNLGQPDRDFNAQSPQSDYSETRGSLTRTLSVTRSVCSIFKGTSHHEKNTLTFFQLKYQFSDPLNMVLQIFEGNRVAIRYF